MADICTFVPPISSILVLPYLEAHPGNTAFSQLGNFRVCEFSRALIKKFSGFVDIFFHNTFAQLLRFLFLLRWLIEGIGGVLLLICPLRSTYLTFAFDRWFLA
jgi:hypothetical protein